MYGIGRLLFKGTKEFIQEQSAKRKLEKKLGRKVSEEELYSLGSHLDAADEAPTGAPLISTPREASVPFGDAKPPMKFLTKLIIAVVLLGIVGIAGALLLVVTAPRHTFSRLNPFGPKPPAGTFPSSLGAFQIGHKPDYEDQTGFSPRPHFDSEYVNGNEKVSYTLWVYNSEAERDADFEARKKYVGGTSAYSKIVESTNDRLFVAAKPGWTSYVLYKDGKNIRQLGAYKQESVLDIEGLMKNAPPAQAVALNDAELAKPAANNSSTTGTNASSVTVLQLLDDYKKDSKAADAKYKNKFITVTGTVEVSDKDKRGNWMIGFMRPGSTAPKDGMVVCSFDKSKEASVSSVKKGSAVSLKGRVMMSLLGTVLLDSCERVL